MILCIDIGNTNSRCAIGTKENYRLVSAETNDFASVDSFTAFLYKHFGSEMPKIEGCMLSSVVPQRKADAMQALKMFDVKVVDLQNMGVDFSQYKTALGEDRAVCAAAAVHKYCAPIIVIDFGTATTVNVANENKIFIGGAIMAGVQTGIDALARDTARLPRICLSDITDFTAVQPVGDNTYDGMVSGAVIGAACAIEGYIRRIKPLFTKPPTVIITGGNAAKVLPHCTFDFIYEPKLLIEGLFLLYENA